MKKRVLLIIVLVVLMAAPAFSFGIGGAFSVGFAGGTVGPGALLSLKLDSFPAVLGVGASFGADRFRLGVTADWWLWSTNLVSIINLYIGPGLYLDIGLGNAEYFGIGARIPVGLQAFIIDPLELFLEIAPTIGFSSVQFPTFGVQSAIGFRFWF